MTQPFDDSDLIAELDEEVVQLTQELFRVRAQLIRERAKVRKLSRTSATDSQEDVIDHVLP